jgi:hypothetical protein
VKKHTIPSDNTFNCQDKSNTSFTQAQTIFHYLQEHTATASMVSDATNIYQKNITRYKRDFEKAGMLWEIEKKLCQKTGFKAWYLTTAPEKAPKNVAKQLRLF